MVVEGKHGRVVSERHVGGSEGDGCRVSFLVAVVEGGGGHGGYQGVDGSRIERAWRGPYKGWRRRGCAGGRRRRLGGNDASAAGLDR